MNPKDIWCRITGGYAYMIHIHKKHPPDTWWEGDDWSKEYSPD